MKNLTLLLTLSALLVACGKDDNPEQQQAVATSPILNQQCAGQAVNPQLNPQYYNQVNQQFNFQQQGSIYNTNGYCLNGQWMTSNQQNGQVGYYGPNGQWVTTGPFYQNGQGQYVPFNQYNNSYYPNGGGYYRYPNQYGNGWNYSWQGWY